jgi:hypothetical protein
MMRWRSARRIEARVLVQREIVGRHGSDRPRPEQVGHDPARGDPALVGVGPLQHLVDQVQQRRPAA